MIYAQRTLLSSGRSSGPISATHSGICGSRRKASSGSPTSMRTCSRKNTGQPLLGHCQEDRAGKAREGLRRWPTEAVLMPCLSHFERERPEFFEKLGFAVKRIGLEAGPLSQWLHARLKRAGFETVLLETRHVKAALSAMTVKTGRKDARGLAQLIRMGWFRPVHAKSIGAQEIRALLVARKQL